MCATKESMAAPNSETGMTDYIFEPIDRMGVDQTPISEKIKLITDLEAVLRDLGVDPGLIDDVVKKTKYLHPLLYLVYRRKPTDEDHIKREGRGVYHDKIPVSGREAIVYVKGIGNEGLIEEIGSEKPFPGFPGDTERLVFDHLLTLSQQPRILGAETLPWGLLEYINSCVVFSAVASKYGWTKMEDALEAGVTVPIGMTHFKELSQYLSDLLQRRIKETHYEEDAKQLEWKGNFVGLGSVGQIVPSDRRLPRLPSEDMVDAAHTAEVTEVFQDSEKYKTSGRTLRRLAEMGIAYSRESSHGQNLYDRGLIAQGDNSDLVFLGDYVDSEVEDFIEGKVKLTGREQRQAIIYRMLNRYDGLTPLAYPLPRFDISWDTIEEAQSKFWTEFLGGIAHPDAIAQIPRLAPVLREQLNLAASLLAVQRLEDPYWDEIAAERKRILKKHDKVGAYAELESNIESDLPSYVTLEYRKKVSTKNVLGHQSMLKFLKTGDRAHIEDDPQLSPYLQLSEAIFNIEDEAKRDDMLYLLGKMQLGRAYDCVVSGPHVELIYAFDNHHIELLRNLVNSGQYDKASKAMDILIQIGLWRLDVTYPHSEAEYVRHYYPYRLLEKDVDIDELHEQVKFIELCLQCIRRTTPEPLYSAMMRETTQRVDINLYASENSVSKPRMIMMATIGAAVDTPELRYRLSGYIQSYNDTYMRLISAKNDDERQAALKSLHSLPQGKIAELYPELVFAHNCTMAVYYNGSEPALAGDYYQKAIEYYASDYERRKKELGIQHDLWYTDPAGAIKRQKSEKKRLQNKYLSLGLTKIAFEYV